MSADRARRPIETLLGAYALVGLLALAWPHRPAIWPLLALIHLSAACALFGLPPAPRAWAALRTRMPRATSLLAHAYPLLLIPFLYAELPLLNTAVWDGRYFDPIIIAWEQTLFGGQPSREWAAALPVLPLSELLHASYLSYYFIIYLPPVLILARRGRDAFDQAVFALMLTFVLHYLFFIWFPVQGPRYLFPAPGGAIAQGGIYQLTHAVLEAGSSRGAAFPSSHVGVAVAQTIAIARFRPALTPVIGLLSLGLALGAIYGGFHYATDAVAGAMLGAAVALTTPALFRAFAHANARP